MLCTKHVSFYLKDCSDDKCNSCPGGADFNVDNECPDVFECTDRATSCSNNGNCNAAADACDCDENFEGIDCSIQGGPIQSKYLQGPPYLLERLYRNVTNHPSIQYPY